MAEKYTLNVAGLTRELTRYPVNDKLEIAAFIMFSDVELTVRCAEELLKKVTDFDIILTSEAKGIPLAYEMARQSGKNYVVARKSVKVYMTNPVSVNVKSITTKDEQMLHLGDEKAGGTVVQSCAALAEGDAAERSDIVFLEKLPLFFK